MFAEIDFMFDCIALYRWAKHRSKFVQAWLTCEYATYREKLMCNCSSTILSLQSTFRVSVGKSSKECEYWSRLRMFQCWTIPRYLLLFTIDEEIHLNQIHFFINNNNNIIKNTFRLTVSRDVCWTWRQKEWLGRRTKNVLDEGHPTKIEWYKGPTTWAPGLVLACKKI